MSQISTGKILENDIPVFVITFATQEMLLFRNVKTGEAVVGAENKVEQCHYAAVVTRVEEELDNELTGGWKVVEVRLLLRSFEPCAERFHRWHGGRPAHTYKRLESTRIYIILHLSRPVHIAITAPLSFRTYRTPSSSPSRIIMILENLLLFNWTIYIYGVRENRLDESKRDEGWCGVLWRAAFEGVCTGLMGKEM